MSRLKKKTEALAESWGWTSLSSPAYTVDGGPIASVLEAADSDRTQRDRRQPLGSGDYVIHQDLDKARNVSRRLYAQSSPYKGFIDGLVTRAIGPGLRPQGLNEDAQRAVQAFIDDCVDGCALDLKGKRSVHRLARVAFTGQLVDGDHLGLRVNVDGHALQLIEGDRLVSPGRSTAFQDGDGTRVSNGIRADEFGRPIEYHIASYFGPGASLKTSGEWKKASAVLHMQCEGRESDNRGLPWLVSALMSLGGLKDFHTDARAAAKLAARLVGVMFTDDPSQTLTGLKETGIDAEAVSNVTPSDSEVFDLGLASIWNVPTEGRLEAFNSSHPSTGVDAFTSTILRHEAAAGLPVEVALKDMSRANFSVARMALQMAEEVAAPLRQNFIQQFYMPAFRWWHQGRVAERDPRVPATLEAQRVRWLSPPVPVVDPVAEANADRLQLDDLTISLSDIAERQGRTRDELLSRIAEDRDAMDRLGLSRVSAPGAVVQDQREQEGLTDTGDSGV